MVIIPYSRDIFDVSGIAEGPGVIVQNEKSPGQGKHTPIYQICEEKPGSGASPAIGKTS
jgi:hypothetical protein